MTLSEELNWRGFVNQTTYKEISALDGDPIAFYWGVDPSADSMTVGNLAIAMMVRHFVDYGHKAILLVGGATGLIGDPDGKSEERSLKSTQEVENNKQKIAEQYKVIFSGQDFTIVDNYDWFKEMGYLEFLRDVGKHVPLRQMLARDFVQKRLGEDGNGISYAEFSYSLIQGYDFLHLHKEYNVALQVCGADQWGNSIAGVELIRRISGHEAHVWSAPLVVNKTTGVKFGKSESGAIWLDPVKTNPITEFYQFWLNTDDDGVEGYLKIYTLLNKKEIQDIVDAFNQDRSNRLAQKTLAFEVTKLVHGQEIAEKAREYAENLANSKIGSDGTSPLRIVVSAGTNLVDVLVETGLATSKTEARQIISDRGVYINDVQVNKESIENEDFVDGILHLRRGKKIQNTRIVELKR